MHIIDADIIIYIYLVACLILLLINLFHNGITSRRNRNAPDKISRWESIIFFQLESTVNNSQLSLTHYNDMMKKLVKMDNFVVFAQALSNIIAELPEAGHRYMRACGVLFQSLAVEYKKKESIERAYFADFVSKFPPNAHSHTRQTQLSPILVAYMDDPSIYCRDNALHAICVLGDAQAVVNAINIIDGRGWFHHYKLITNRLLSFSGDKNALAAMLWAKYGQWSDYLMQAVVQFVTIASPDYKKVFFGLLQDESVDHEIRLAALRYFNKHKYKPILPLLIHYLTDTENPNSSLSVVAASVLARYPGKKTASALIQALTGNNWYVRNNAAAALIQMNASDAVLDEILNGSDLYAKEILKYKLEQELENLKGELAAAKESI